MIHPSYKDLMNAVNANVEPGEEPVVNSRYSIVSATAKRARQIIDGQEPMISGAYDMKPLSIAVKELYEGDLKILTDEEAAAKEAEMLAEEEAAAAAAAEAAEAEEAEEESEET